MVLDDGVSSLGVEFGTDDEHVITHVVVVAKIDGLERR
jgi:hypothetical protein